MTPPAVYYLTDRLFQCERPDAEAREAMCGWLRRHSIDPMHVWDEGLLVRDLTRRRVCYVGWEFDDDGYPALTDDGQDIAWRMCWVQLEAEPEPWPDIVVRKAKEATP